MSDEPPPIRAQPIDCSFKREEFEPFNLEPKINLARRSWDIVRTVSRHRNSLTDFSLEGNYMDVRTGTYIECLYADPVITRKDTWFMGRIVCQTIEPTLRGQKYGLKFSYGPKYTEFLSYCKDSYPRFEFGRINVRPEKIMLDSKKPKGRKSIIAERTQEIIRESLEGISEKEISSIEARLRASGQIL